MSGEIRTTAGALTAAAQLVGAARSDLDKQCTDLRRRLEQIGQHWAGAGSLAFRQVMERWDIETMKVISALDTFESNLSASEATYTAQDQSVQSAMSRLAGRLG